VLWNPVEVLLSHMDRASLSVHLVGVMAQTVLSWVRLQSIAVVQPLPKAEQKGRREQKARNLSDSSSKGEVF